MCTREVRVKAKKKKKKSGHPMICQSWAYLEEKKKGESIKHPKRLM